MAEGGQSQSQRERHGEAKACAEVEVVQIGKMGEVKEMEETY